MPPVSTERELASELDTTKRLQAETAAGLDAVLPAVLDRPFNGGA